MNTMVSVSDWILRRKIVFFYLIVPDPFRKSAEITPSEQFEAAAARFMNAYINDGTMPPADIAPAIMNMADDYMAGRQITIRSGDYLAIQNHLRKQA